MFKTHAVLFHVCCCCLIPANVCFATQEETDRPGVFKAAVRAEDNKGTLTVMRLGNDTVEWTYSHSSAEGVVVPTLAKAKRADLDLEGTMWNLYATGNWAPGEDEAKKLVFEWTKKNTDKV